MAFSTFGGLKTAIEDWCYDSSAITGYLDDIVTLSQAYLNRRLRCREMITQATLTISSGLFTIPTGYLQWRSLVQVTSPRRRLQFITYDKADDLYPDRPAGLANHFTIIGSSIRAFPTPTTSLELTYYAALSAPASDSATDWLLTKMPNVYLNAGQMFAAEFLKDDAEMQKQAAILDIYIAMLNSEDDAAELAGAGSLPAGPTP